MSPPHTRFLQAFVLAACVWQAACAETTTEPGSLRFGQIGEVRLNIATPLLLGEGELQQSLTWNSAGPWQLTEEISYRGKMGDTVTTKSTINPERLAGSYAVWITQVNETQGLRLFTPELDATLNPQCGFLTRVTLRIRDAVQDEEARWLRCAEGTLTSLDPSTAWPDPAAARVASAALLLREYTLPHTFSSAFASSYPFGTITKGDNTDAPIDAPKVIDNQAAWTQLWVTLGSNAATTPFVDFTKEVVLFASIGKRPEAGESVEIRRVIPVDDGTLVQIVHRLPGNFCSPVSREHRPFHVVVTPKVPLPITFAQVIRQEVPCT
jgi:hypothetical protein